MGDITNKFKIFVSLAILSILFLSTDSSLFFTSIYAQNQNIESDFNIFTETDETKLPMTTDDGNSNVSGLSTVNSPWAYVRMILVLALIVAIIYVVFKILKKKPEVSTPDRDPFLRKVASISVSPGKTVQVVSLVDHAYIIGVGDDNITLIDEVKDKELIDAMNLYADKNQKNERPKSFNEILEIFMPKKKDEENNKNVFDGATKQIMDSLEKQREKLNEEDN